MPNLVSIAVTALSSPVMGGSVSFSATGTYDDASTAVITNSVAWSQVSQSPTLASTGINLLNLSPTTGVATSSKASLALNGGSAVVKATLGSISGTATVVVQPLAIATLGFVTNPLSLPFSTILPQAAVIGTMNDGSQMALNRQTLFALAFSSTVPAVASFIDSSGSMHFGRAGQTVLSVASGSASSTVTLTVTPLLRGVRIDGNATTPIGGTTQLTVFAEYNDGISIDVTSQVVWSGTSGLISIDTTGLATGLITGSTSLIATFGGYKGVRSFVVPALVSSDIVPEMAGVVGRGIQFDLIQSYSDGSSVNLNSTATWISSNSAVGTINAAGGFACLSPGTSTVSALIDGRQVTQIVFTVIAAVVTSIAISSTSLTVESGSTVQLTAIATFSTGIQTDITSLAQWTSANLSASISSSALVTGQAAGLAVLIATYQGVQGSFKVNVFPAVDPSLQPQFLSYLTQEMKNYFDENDVRVREAKYTIDAQLLNVAAQPLELSIARLAREYRSTRLTDCPANIDNKGVYFQQILPSSFDFTIDHLIQGTINSSLTDLIPYNAELPVPTRANADTRFTPLPLTNSTIFQVTGQGVVATSSWAVQRISNPVLPAIGRMIFWLDGNTFNQVGVRVRITGQRAPQPVWASRQSQTSETLTLNLVGTSKSKFAWASITEIQISGLPVGATLSGQIGSYGLTYVADSDRPYIDPAARDVRFPRYWTYEDGLLKEKYLASNYQGFRYIQSYAAAPISAIAIEPNTSGMFLAQGTSLVYVDRREPMPSNLNVTALTVEPNYGLDVSIDETREGSLRYVVLRPVPYAKATDVSQYRFLVQTPQGTTYALTPDGVMATYSSTAGWRRGAPITLTIPLAQIGTYVITLQCAGANNVLTSDVVPYPNLALAPKITFDLSSIVPSIEGMSFDDRGRLWIWSGNFIIPLSFHYDAYLLDPTTQSIYLTDLVTGLTIDALAI